MTTTPTSDLSTFLGDDPDLNRLYDNVQATVPSVVLSMIKMLAWNTIEEFYLQSTSRRECVNWQMASGVSTIDFNPFDADWQVGWVLQVTGLTNFKINMPGQLVDLDPATALRTGQALLALKPHSFTCCSLPPELFIQWFETILDGTLFRLFAQPAKPYSSPQLAAYHGRRYRGGMARARGIAQQGNTGGGGRWAFPAFASGQRKN